MSGLELAQAVHRASPYTPVVLMTAHSDGAQLRNRMQALELAGCLYKPFSMKEMQDVIRASVDGVT